MDEYRLLAADYEALMPRAAVFDERPFFERLVREHGVRTCLDCACGPGWHLAMLADLGVACCGSDVTPEMLALAERNLAGRAIPLRVGDFRALENVWEQRFDLIICMTTSFPHMLTEADAVAALRSMWDRLNPGGLLVMDSGNSDALFDARPKLIPARVHQDQAFYFFLEYPNDERVIFNILHVKKTEAGFDHTLTVMHYNVLRQEVLARYFAQIPFESVSYYGDFDFADYSAAESRRLIAVAQKGR